MSYLALYRKYRPNSFDDLVGQSYVSEIIKKEILDNQISHAYLFSGPRGTGKTSTAKIIARMINCLNLGDDGVPCGKCESCVNINNNSDIVEIDAASNNGVDEIRELRDKVNLVPTSGKYKIYIIDEVHMLTTQAFNALLKTLEEPPSHIIFILATTELNKIPITVVSRCQKFQFKKFSNDEIVSRLSKISDLEGINVGNDVLYEIARLSDGGLRDAINMLDQLSSYKSDNINVLDVYKLSGVISYNDIYNFLLYIYHNESDNIIKFIENIDREGKSLIRFLEDLLSYLKDILLYMISSKEVNLVEKQGEIVELSKLYSYSQIYDLIFSINDLINNVKNSSCSSILVVSFFVKYSLSFNDNVIVGNKEVDNIVNEDVELNKEDNNIHISENKVLSEDVRRVRINNSFATASKAFKDNMINNWNLVLEKVIDSKYSSIVGILNDTEVAVVGDEYLIMLAKYDSLVDRLYKCLNIIEDLLFESFGKKYRVVFLVNDEWLYEKNKYIESLKKGIKYVKMNEIADISNELDDDNNSDIDKIVSIFGNDIIEYK